MSTTDDLRGRMAKVIDEYLQLDTALRDAEGNHFRVCIFGSARIQPDDAIYKGVHEVALKLAAMGIDIVTGGGPGLMEAANSAVREAKVKRVRSIGLPLDIPGLTEVANAHLDIKSMHRRFSSRLDEFMRLSDGVIVAPGGIGTLLELFYVWQLLQLSMVSPRPVVLLGRDYWGGLIKWMEDEALGHRLVSPPDMSYIRIVDSPEEAVQAIAPAFEAYKEQRRADRAKIKADKLASLEKVQTEVAKADPVLEEAKKAPAADLPPLLPNGEKPPLSSAPAAASPPPRGAHIVTPVDAANVELRTAASSRGVRQRRRRAARRR